MDLNSDKWLSASLEVTALAEETQKQITYI